MSGTHGDLFREIGALVVAAHGGQRFDLKHTSEELARCYVNLGVPADTMERAIARSMAAVGVSMAMLRSPERSAPDGEERADGVMDSVDGAEASDIRPSDDDGARSASVLLPSGVRLAMVC